MFCAAFQKSFRRSFALCQQNDIIGVSDAGLAPVGTMRRQTHDI